MGGKLESLTGRLIFPLASVAPSYPDVHAIHFLYFISVTNLYFHQAGRKYRDKTNHKIWWYYCLDKSHHLFRHALHHENWTPLQVLHLLEKTVWKKLFDWEKHQWSLLVYLPWCNISITWVKQET